MRKLLVFIVLFLPVLAKAQTDSLATKGKEQYCMVTEVPKIFGKSVNISVDFGQQKKTLGLGRLTDEEGKVKSFNSIVDGLNYMASQGWELVNSYVVKSSPETYEAHYMMKRKFENN
jgi:hypothetical protein